MNLKVYINVAVLGNVNDVLKFLLKKIDESGLLTQAECVKLVVNGDIKQLDISSFRQTDKLVIFHANESTEQCEFPGLYDLWKDSFNSDHKILYLHTKGVSKKQTLSSRNWLSYMSYFNIEKWKIRVNELIYNDCVGVNIKGESSNLQVDYNKWGYLCAPLHYSGNFWWSKSSYIRTLPDPYKWCPDNNYKERRIFCEMWLLQGSGKFYNAYQSGVKHYMGEPFPALMYRNDPLNKVIRLFISPFFKFYIRLFRKLKPIFF